LTTLRFALHQGWLLLRSRWHRFGYACVNFGTPVSVRAWAAARGIVFEQLDRERRQAEVAALGRHLMQQVGTLIPVLPVPLVATVLLAEPERALSEFEIKGEASALVSRLEAAGAHVYVPRSDWDYAISAGLRMLVQRHLVVNAEGLYLPVAAELPLLRYYANSIAHLARAEPVPVAQRLAA
jgi:glycerol-3-phosphate O-acyltransferase